MTRTASPAELGRHLASLYSPPTERRTLQGLFSVESEIAASTASGLDHSVAHARLHWWREECARVAKGSPAHPLTRALVADYSHAPADTLAGLSGFVDLAVWDLATATFETRREVGAYCERWASAMLVPAAVHAVPSLRDVQVWVAIGSAMHEIELLGRLTSEARVGRLRLPLDELERAGVAPESLAVTPYSPQLATLLGERHEALRSALARSVARVERSAQPAVRGLLVWAAIASWRSERARRALPGSVLPGRFDPVAQAWRAWRAARHAMAGKASLS